MTGHYNADNVWIPDTPPKKKKLSKKQKARKGHCVYCMTTENLTTDHIIPVSEGGTNARRNLQTLCKQCNSMKGNKSERAIHKIIRWVRMIDANRKAIGVAPLA